MHSLSACQKSSKSDKKCIIGVKNPGSRPEMTPMFVAGAATKARLCSLRALTRTELVPDSNLAGATGELYYDGL